MHFAATTTGFRFGWCVFLLAVGASLGGCSSSSSDQAESKDVAIVKVEFPEGDASVAAEDGGPGFTGEGWLTATAEPLGDPRAVKGGVMSTPISSWPENLRRYGTGSNTWLNYAIRDLCYESLCDVHQMTLEVIPNLASHWQISDDHMTFRFRIDPRAHWSDGRPVVAQDWVATYRLMNDDTLIDPMMKQTICEKMEEPIVLSKYMLEIKCKEKDWRNFLAISALTPLPAHEIEGMPGEQYLKDYNFRYTATSGPYRVQTKDIKKNESVTVTRRKDYWAADDEWNVGRYNFDRIRFVVIRDRKLAFDKVCKGEIDFHSMATAKWWVENVTPLPEHKNGQLIRREIFTRYPKGIQGLAFNMREPPLDDINVRKALIHLYDRKTMLTKFAYDQYLRLKSYYPGSDYENPENEMMEYDPSEAIRLLTESGWTERDTDGVLTKDGKRLSIAIMYRTEIFEKYLTSYQEACRKVGVELMPRRVTDETLWKNMMERTFQVASMGWGQILYPNPRSNWTSGMADRIGSNNITGLKNHEVDALVESYDAEFDVHRRMELLRQLDAAIYSQFPYALDWYNPSERLLYWNKFGMPEYGLPRYAEYEHAFIYWWYDAEKAKRLKETRERGESMGPIPPLQLRPWDDDSALRQARLN